MIKDLLFWVAPGALTVIGTTGVALAMASPVMVADLTAKGRAQLDASDASWAEVAATGRDLFLTGSTDSEQKRSAAERVLAALPGTGTVDNRIFLAAAETPFRLKAIVEDGVITLRGSVPNQVVLEDLTHRVEVANLAVHAGYPDLQHWREGVDFAIARAAEMESGEIELSDLT
ncbi:BON domain-containing protein [Devosia aurantiaca]|uniref:BON domain-containing protein n=1 Tax=Devosia aurantiaca TaxID=2714858 RepID=A0A6M1SHT6_9HYPH|nr:BON domain-containing protein [Devosia aurantiaca]NGP19027.1 BON domain-containing protein [Devosia aurantiaca]